MIPKTEFGYSSRRSVEEAVRAINARTDAAATAHHRLSLLHSARALVALRDESGDDFWCDGSVMVIALLLFAAGGGASKTQLCFAALPALDSRRSKEARTHRFDGSPMGFSRRDPANPGGAIAQQTDCEPVLPQAFVAYHGCLLLRKSLGHATSGPITDLDENALDFHMSGTHQTLRIHNDELLHMIEGEGYGFTPTVAVE